MRDNKGHLTTVKLQSFGGTAASREAIRYIQRTNKCSRLTTLGISTRCSLLLSYLGDFGSSAKLEAAVCISPMYDYHELAKTTRKPYHWLSLQKYKYFLTKHCNVLGGSIDLDKAFASSSLGEWEKSVYGRMCKLEDEDEYWDENNPLREVDEIAVPLLCINSKDDPISTSDQIPYDLFTTLPNLHLVTTKHGGHCGFYEDVNPQSWAFRLSMDYIASVLKYSAIVTNSIKFQKNKVLFR
ncbi:protein ABHD15-like [Amphiura filiformis]|uniref:protein ABHD15-like n=1 Tax=Amphiura filiformis TaxID=82378 RepID=UPI003B2201EE